MKLRASIVGILGLTPAANSATVGMSYETAIFANSAEQQRLAEASKRKLQHSGALKRPIVTPIEMAGPFHPAPKRQFGVLIEGELEVTAGDGEVRTFKAGEVRFLEDTFGKGHQTKVVGDRDVLNAIVQLD